MVNQQAVKTFARDFQKLDNAKSVYDKFRDFCEMAYCAFAKVTASTEKADALEARYMQIVNTYPNKDTVRAYPRFLAMVIENLEMYDDFLGAVAGEMGVLDGRMGQFFTPMEVSRMIARSQFTKESVAPIIERNGYITVYEPAAGAGGMVLAAAETMRQIGFDPTVHMLVYTADISMMAYHMCYVQLTCAGVSALVCRENSLSLERFDAAWTGGAMLFQHHHGYLSFKSKQEETYERVQKMRAFLNQIQQPQTQARQVRQSLDQLPAGSKPDFDTTIVRTNQLTLFDWSE